LVSISEEKKCLILNKFETKLDKNNKYKNQIKYKILTRDM